MTSKEMNRKVLLMILDGWGIATDRKASAPDQADTPFIDSCYEEHPNCVIKANGVAVGLPEGQMGNSEVGHIHIGAGRVVYQNLVKINVAIEDKTLHHHEILLEELRNARRNNKQVHFIGLLSDGGIHSHIHHLKALCDIARDHEITKLFIHAFTDGRDTDPRSGKGFIEEMQKHLEKSTGKIASVTGRYYAMDRDNQWNRIKVAYDALVKGKGTLTEDIIRTMKEKYEQGETDEFIRPIIMKKNGSEKPLATFREGDTVLFFNFRPDRARQLSKVLTQEDMKEKGMERIDLDFITMTPYDDTFKDIDTLFSKKNLENTLGELISEKEKKQLRIAETQKYPHVTYFFSGGREEPFDGEDRIMVKSSDISTYDKKPEMSAYEIKDKILPELEEKKYDLICLNFANLDMVGHTGVFEAAIKACEAVDDCAGKISDAAVRNDYVVIITADHGNSEYMINENGSPNTAHTSNPVPLFLINGPEDRNLEDGTLTDIAPTILSLMGIEIPEVMTGKNLLKEKVDNQ